MIKLRPYQQQAVEAFQAHLERGSRWICHLATGLGKTILALDLCRRYDRVLWLAHRDELVRQPEQKIRYVYPEADTGIVKAQRDEYDADDVVFASVQTASRPSRLTRLLDWGDFDLIVTDEAHHAAAPTWRRVLAEFNGTPVLGLTATPERGDGKSLEDVFDGICYTMGIHAGISQGYLSPVECEQIPIEGALQGIPIVRGDCDRQEMAASLVRAKAAGFIARELAERHEKALVFCVSVAASKETARACKRAGLRSAHIDGSMPVDERRDVLQRFADGDIDTLCNCEVLLEGYDEPSITCVVMARPTMSKPLYVQMVGRGTRVHPDKDRLLVLDLVDNASEHDLIQAPVIFGEPDRGDDDKASKGEVTTATGPSQGPRELRLVNGVTVAPRRGFQWLQIGRKRVLPAGPARVYLEPVGDLYRPVARGRQRQDEVLAGMPVPIEIACGLAEDYARRVGSLALAQSDAPWRQKAATDAQIEALRKWRIDVEKEGLTRGEASDLLDAAAARKGL